MGVKLSPNPYRSVVRFTEFAVSLLDVQMMRRLLSAILLFFPHTVRSWSTSRRLKKAAADRSWRRSRRPYPLATASRTRLDRLRYHASHLRMSTVTTISGAGSFNDMLDGIEEGKLVVVKFFAPWCRACKGLEPKFKKAAMQVGFLVLYRSLVHSRLHCSHHHMSSSTQTSISCSLTGRKIACSAKQ